MTQQEFEDLMNKNKILAGIGISPTNKIYSEYSGYSETSVTPPDKKVLKRKIVKKIDNVVDSSFNERSQYMAVDKRENDLILAPNEYVLVSDETSGKVNVIVGPKKESLAGTDQPMRFDGTSQRYIRCSLSEAIQRMPYADERSYIILQNPATNESNPYPKAGTSNSLTELKVGQTINIKGPTTFALWPGQTANVIPGHQLRSNQYLLVRVTNVDQVYGNSEAADGEVRLATGQLNIIKGTEVAFYIPPTGIEVLKDENNEYVRDALTLERLEYCVLKDENGEKRYVRGPAVVFPKPTETFIEKGNNHSRKFKAVELNENMGLYIKVISDYNEGKQLISAGEELFVTGKELKIYFPRPEHAIIKYGQQILHYAVAIPKGEARYVLDKNSGEVRTVKGPTMFLPDPRSEVIVKRVLSPKEVELWFPGNKEALLYNTKALSDETVLGAATYYSADMSAKNLAATAGQHSRSTIRLSDEAVLDDFADGVKRGTEFTPPRTITLNNKYEGAVMINVWPGYAIQIVNRTGERKVIQGPQTVILDYDQTLETLALSTGRPKSDTTLLKTAYLHVKNNKVSDQVTVQTKDLVDVSFTLSYRVNFEDDCNKWFSVQNYIKLMSDNIRSIIRKEIKNYGIQEINDNAISIIRDVILGVKDVENSGKRKGRSFDENGMIVYDVEILDIQIGNKKIAELLINAQHQTVSNTIELAQSKSNMILTKEKEAAVRETMMEQVVTQQLKIDNEKELTSKLIENEKIRQAFEVEKSKIKSVIAAEELNVEVAKKNIEISSMKEKINIQTDAVVKQMSAIGPDLVAAINNLGDKQLATALAQNLPKATGTQGLLFGTGGIDGLLKMVSGTAMEETIKQLISKKNYKTDITE